MDAKSIAYQGSRLTIEYAVLPDGKMPAKTFVEGLTHSYQARVLVLFQRLGDHGVIKNPEHFKKVVGSDFFEFKRHQVRILAFSLPGRRFILTHGFRKKKDKIDKAELSRAARIRETCLNFQS